MIYTIREAQATFSQILSKALRGEEVIIARGKMPVAKLVPIPSVTVPHRKQRKPGRWKGKISFSADAFDPLSKEELAEWGIE